MKKLTSSTHCVHIFMNFVDLFQILLLKGLGNMIKRCNSEYLTKIISKLPTFFGMFLCKRPIYIYIYIPPQQKRFLNQNETLAIRHILVFLEWFKKMLYEHSFNVFIEH